MKFLAFNNGWSWGQFTFFRVLLGTYLLIHFFDLLPWSAEIFSAQGMLANGGLSPLLHVIPNIFALNDSALFVQACIITCLIASLFLILGIRDKVAALWMLYILACLFGRNPLIANPALPYVGFMLLCIAFIPRPLPSHGYISWSLPRDVFMAAWFILALTYSYSGYTKLLSPSWASGDNIYYVLNNPLARDYFLRDIFLALPPIFLKCLTWAVLYIELFFAPLAIFLPRLRFVMWSLMAMIQVGFALLLNFLDLTAGMLLFHLLTFDPQWIKGRCGGRMTLFYDGDCGLCHATVRFFLGEDKTGHLTFSPLQGEYLKSKFSSQEIQAFPDSIVLLDADGKVYLKSSAVIVMLMAMGGIWRPLGYLLWLVPRPLRNALYSGIGSVRKKLLHKPDDLCPLIPSDIRDRFVV